MMQFFTQQLQHNPFFFTAFVAGIISAAILFLKNTGRELYSLIQSRLVFTCCIFQSDPLFNDFEMWFYANYSEKYRNVEASVNEVTDTGRGLPEQIGKLTTISKVFFKQSEGVFYILYKGKFILIRKGREKLEHATDIRSIYFNQYHFYSIKGSDKIKDMLETAVRFASEKLKANELKIYSNQGYGGWQRVSTITSKSLDDIIINEDRKQQLKADMDLFLNSKQEYDRRHIFYKRGYGFFGDPGNGKTSLALAVASYMNKDIYCLDLNSLNDNNSLREAFSGISNNAVLLIEDIDGFYKLRTPVKKDTKISFSTLLNCTDGVLYKEGLVLIITTNIISDLDPALIRAGRIDLLFEVPKPSATEVNKYLQIFYNRSESFNPIQESSALSMCDIQQICLANRDSYVNAIDEIFKREIFPIESQ